jgi:hypothetical protein
VRSNRARVCAGEGLDAPSQGSRRSVLFLKGPETPTVRSLVLASAPQCLTAQQLRLGMERPPNAALEDFPDVLALVFERLPPIEQCVTVSRVARAWRRWAAAPRRDALRVEWRWVRSHRRQLPQWCLAEAWPRLSEPQRGHAALRAAACGDVERLRWLQAQEPCCLWTLRQMCSEAARNGHLDVLRWLRAQDPPACLWDAQTSWEAARGGHLDVLRWLRAQDPPCPWQHQMISAAAAGGHLDVLRWLRAQDPPCDWSLEACTAAAGGGHLDVLRWLRAQHPPCFWDETTCSIAALRGHLDALRWLRAQDPPCPWGVESCTEAARCGHLDVLKWPKTRPARGL